MLEAQVADRPQALIPYDRREGLSLQQAAGIAGRSGETLRRWCEQEDIGRRIGGRWVVSHPALLMFLDGDERALRRYLSGDRADASVLAYFTRAGVPPPRHREEGLAAPPVRPPY